MNYLKKYPISIACALFIFVLSVKNIGEMPKMNMNHGDKLGHFIAYFTLAALLVYERYKQYRTSNKRSLNRVVLLKYPLFLSVVYGIVIELLQGGLLPYRYFDLSDIFANITGSIVGALIVSLFLNESV